MQAFEADALADLLDGNFQRSIYFGHPSHQNTSREKLTLSQYNPYLLEGCPANDMKTFRAYMNKNGADLNSEEKKLVEDRRSHEKAAADLEISNVLLQTALSSTLGTCQ